MGLPLFLFQSNFFIHLFMSIVTVLAHLLACFCD